MEPILNTACDCSFQLSPDGTVIVRVLGATHTLANAQASLEQVKKLTQARKRPILVDIRKVEHLEAEARAYYGNESPNYASRLALLTESSLSKLLANTYFLAAPFFSDKRKRIPMSMFDREDKALRWLAEENKQASA